MTVFDKLYNELAYPLEIREGETGFRPAQLAAIHSVSAHAFSKPEQPAIVSMPTGSGKTLILVTLSIVLRAKRVLVLTPSRLVREQIAEEFKTLNDLVKIGALPALGVRPKVKSTNKRVASPADWLGFEEFDAVVATVSAISGKNVPLPPEGLFDLILVDEAHHSPAITWKRLLDAQGSAKQALFTATPFRRDERQLPGKIVFHYDLDKANADRVFGDINFSPVLVREGQNADEQIALAAEDQFNRDRKAGLDHLVMVRVDTRKRGKFLHQLYREKTALRLEYVTGNSSLRTVRAVINKLKKRELDGIVCVDMFGEGFNLPNLKIAAVHTPHKSLAVTLQFIGRFARTTAENVGSATFLAEPRQSAQEIDELYVEGASWQKIVTNLSVGRITSEADNRAKLDTFESEASAEIKDLHLGLLKPYYHAKIYRCEQCDLSKLPRLPGNAKIAYQSFSAELNTAVFVTQQSTRPRWISDERFRSAQWELYVLYHDQASKLLFICASDRSAEAYKHLSQQYVGEGARTISAKQVNFALSTIDGARFFNVGMRKRSRLGLVESYRTLAGPRADHAVIESDGRVYDRGHCFGKGRRGGVEATLGVSAAGKVWSNKATQLPDFVSWCQEIAQQIATATNWKTGSPMDALDVGRELTAIPEGIVGAMWSPPIYENPRDVLDLTTGEVIGTLLDFDIEVSNSVAGSVEFRVYSNDVSWHGNYAIGQRELVIGNEDNIELGVEHGGSHVRLEDFLSDEPPVFFTQEFQSIQGIDIYDPPISSERISSERLTGIDWSGAGVDIQQEKTAAPPKASIFNWLEQYLVNSSAEFVFCDDAAGEIADYVALRWEDGAPIFDLFHCKGSGAEKPGARVNDFYEVAFQAAKCAVWAQQTRMMEQLKKRYRKTPGRLKKGKLADVDRAFAPENRQRIQFHSIIVQPGLSKAKLSGSPVEELLAAANTYVLHSGMYPIRIMCSS